MKKIILFSIIAIAILIGGFFVLNNYIYNEKQGDQKPALSPKEATYVIDGRVIRLINGVSETTTPTSATKITTHYFGNEVRKDIDNDGREDAVFLLSQEKGSSTFYYVVAALNTEVGYIGSQGLLLGDRIAPQTTESGTGKIVVVNYADRKPGESFEIKPSLGKSIRLLLDTTTMQFGEVVENFEGEADPSRMTLGMQTWTWISATYNDGKKITPRKEKVFTLTLADKGAFSATTDCNTLSGKYSVNKNQITFNQIASTKMYCEGSQESDFTTLLQNTQSYFFTSKGEMIFDLKFDSGSVIFR